MVRKWANVPLCQNLMVPSLPHVTYALMPGRSTLITYRMQSSTTAHTVSSKHGPGTRVTEEPS